ncbi:MAG: hypothetical protein QM790_19590 [Nibricoccus sp.]
MDFQTKTARLISEFTLDLATLRQISLDFEKAMDAGLAGQKSTLKMLPSFVGLPTGGEYGSALAIDFGGTNVRTMNVNLDGNRGARINNIRRIGLKNPVLGRDLTTEESTGEELFQFIAQELKDIPKSTKPQPLGCTFSFPCDQINLKSAKLINWTKEFKTRDTVGREINELLTSGLVYQSLEHIEVTAIINDTVGTLLAGSYQSANVDIAAICGTGHNACYLEPTHPLTGAPMIVNIESGNFDGIPQTRFDKELDLTTYNPGSQQMEKMVSGRYLGVLIGRVLQELYRDTGLPISAQLAELRSISGEDIDNILLDVAPFETIAKIFKERFDTETTAEQRQAIQKIIRAISERSARIVAATFAGIVRHIDSAGERPHVIAIDGSLYEKIPKYSEHLQNALRELLGQQNQVRTILAKDGSGLGAAVAAILAVGSADTNFCYPSPGTDVPETTMSASPLDDVSSKEQ